MLDTHAFVAQKKSQEKEEVLPKAFPKIDGLSYPSDARPEGKEEEWENRAHLLVALDPEVINDFVKGYEEDPFFKQ